LQLKNFADTCYRYNETATNVPPVAGSSSSWMFPRVEEIGSLFSKNTGLSSRDNVTVGLTRYEAKASEAINLIQSSSHMLVQAHKDFIHHLWTAMGKEPVDTSGTDTRGGGPGMEVHRIPSEEFSFMHSGAIGNEATNPPTHRILFPLIFFNLHHANSYLLQGPELRSRHSANPTSGHGEDVQHELTTDV
jgi:hypothetical protein